MPFSKHEKETHSNLMKKIVLVTTMLVMVFSVVAVRTWKGYRLILMDNQKEQLFLISQALAQNIAVSLTEYQDSTAFFCKLENSGQTSSNHYKEYIAAQTGIICDICWLDSNGNYIKSIKGVELISPVMLGRPRESMTLWQYNDDTGKRYLVVRGELESHEFLALVIDEEAYYEQLISGLHVGTNGYVVIKTSDQTIVMHPSREQWGIDVIEGRKALFPDLDYTSLEEMVNEQVRTDSGVMEYYSYWWMEPELPRVKKVASHAWAKLGQDFWIVSTIVDYSDFYEPIRASFNSMLAIFLCVLSGFLLFAVYIGKLLLERQRNTNEIEYLRELNETLEEVHRSEEVIIHQQRLQVMGAMTSGIAHEFNNFLTPIMGYADLLMAELPEDGDAYDNAREIYETSEKAKEMIRQISSLGRKNVETVYKSVEADRLLHHVSKMVQTACPKNVQFETDIRLKGECFLGNDTQLSQVLINICMNAFQAIGCKEGTLKITAWSMDKQEMIRQFPDSTPGGWERYIRIDVTDNGCGMDTATLRRIFEPFYTTKKVGEGTGLGLSLAEQIIRSHRGMILAESKLGVGSTFHVFLPVLEPSTEQKPILWGQSRNMRLIVADDNRKILELFKRRFAKLGMEAYICSRKADILEALERNDAEALAIDESLEDCNGIDFCMSIYGKHTNLVKVMMVDVVTREVVEARKRGIIDGYIDKPVSIAMLLQTIHECRKEKLT